MYDLNCALEDHSEASVTDLYPSRTGEPARRLPRRDPIVYGAPDGSDGPLSGEQIESYASRGYLLLQDFFSEREVEELMDELRRLSRDPDLAKAPETITELESGEVRSIFRVHQISPRFRALAADERLAGIAQQILASDVYIHQSRVNYKPGFAGKEFFWHSDFETWHVEDGLPRMRTLSMSISLTENTEHNGPLMLIPGSHREFIACEGKTPENHHQQSLKRQVLGTPPAHILRDMVERGGIVSATGRPGSLLIFDCNTLHGSSGNISPLPRSNLFFVFNSIENQPVAPFSGLAPRPEFLGARETIEPLDSPTLRSV